MKSKDEISKGPKKRDPTSYQLQRDIVIPAGTILRQASTERGGPGYVECAVGHGAHFTSYLIAQLHPDAEASGDFKKVIAP